MNDSLVACVQYIVEKDCCMVIGSLLILVIRFHGLSVGEESYRRTIDGLTFHSFPFVGSG